MAKKDFKAGKKIMPIEIKEKSPVFPHLRKETKEDIKIGASLFGMVFILLVLSLLLTRFRGSDGVPTFTGLLEWFSGFSAPEIPFINATSVVLGDWGIFNWLRDFISFFVGLLNIILFLVNGLLSLMFYVIHFFSWLFLGG